MALFGLDNEIPSGGIGMLNDLYNWLQQSSPGVGRYGTGPQGPVPIQPTQPAPPAQGFDDSAPAPGMPMQAPGMPPVQDMDITPEAIARNAAARGVPPPPTDIAPQWADARGADFGLGGALTGNVPMPRPRPGMEMGGRARGGGAPSGPMNIRSEAQKEGEAAPQGAPQKPMGDRLMDALKGVKMPANPELQRISSPSAPRPAGGAIRGGDIIALLQGLSQGRGGAGGMALPQTLGAALRG